jgi:hypothetical protein
VTHCCFPFSFFLSFFSFVLAGVSIDVHMNVTMVHC